MTARLRNRNGLDGGRSRARSGDLQANTSQNLSDFGVYSVELVN